MCANIDDRGEAQNPRKAIPRAVKLTFFRIVFFYLALILLLGMTVPYDSPLLLSSVNTAGNTVNADASPFVSSILSFTAKTPELADKFQSSSFKITTNCE